MLAQAFFPGIEGAEAIACALYGEAGCNKWGRLPVTVFPETFVKNDMADMGVTTGGSGLRTYKCALFLLLVLSLEISRQLSTAYRDNKL
jgi:hypothetical protein